MKKRFRGGNSSTWDAILSLAGAAALTGLILVILVLATRRPTELIEEETGAAFNLTTVANPEPEDIQPAQANRPDLSSMLPASSPPPVADLVVAAEPLDIPIDLSQMLKQRFSYRDLGRASLSSASFGVSQLSDVDDAIEDIFIPPNWFPDHLIDQGIVEGRVVIRMIVDEEGRVDVTSVLDSTHPDLIQPVVDSFNRSLYSIPMRNGRPTKVVITRVVVFTASEDRIQPSLN